MPQTKRDALKFQRSPINTLLLKRISKNRNIARPSGLTSLCAQEKA